MMIQEFFINGGDTAQSNGKKKGLTAITNNISCYLFDYLEGFHIPTHYVQRVSETESLVRKLEIFPLLVKVYNYAVETLPKRFGLKEGAALEFPVIEYYYKNPDGGLSWINEYHLYSFRLATPDDVKQVNRVASKANAVLRSLCTRRQLGILLLQLEFGKADGQVFLSDELTPRTCSFIDCSASNKAGRERFLSNGKENVEALVELFDRLSLKI
jgi:phosphoribosylaminoimidazole-succinocarboxamide synthase